MGKTLYGDAFIALELDSIDYGEPDELHAVFDWAIKHGAKSLKVPHPMNVYQRVLNGLDSDERFEKSYFNYDGIYNKPVRCFQLKNDMPNSK